jgi:glutamyl-tRNA synthetase
VNDALAAFFPPPVALPVISDPAAAEVVRSALEILRATTWNADALTAALQQVTAATGARGRALYEPLRVALTGANHGPPFVPLLQVQGREVVLQRLTRALGSEAAT